MIWFLCCNAVILLLVNLFTRVSGSRLYGFCGAFKVNEVMLYNYTVLIFTSMTYVIYSISFR